MGLGNLKRPAGAVRKRKRIARGDASGSGGTSGRGHKGQLSRSGGGVRPGFEGGQMPLQRRMPKRGFKNIHRKPYVPINLRDLVQFDAGTVVEPSQLVAAGLIPRITVMVKILGLGELDRALTVRAQAFSKTAKEKIEKAGGQAEPIAPIRRKEKPASQES
jgi:large subunit ribosomal protein L15